MEFGWLQQHGGRSARSRAGELARLAGAAARWPLVVAARRRSAGAAARALAPRAGDGRRQNQRCRARRIAAQGGAAPAAGRARRACSPSARAARRPWAPARPSRPTSMPRPGPCCSEAGGHRAKAKDLLRRRVNGNGAGNGKLNGSEAAYWRQLGALSLLDSTGDALAAYARAAELAPDDRRGADAGGRAAAAGRQPRRRPRPRSGARSSSATALPAARRRYRGRTMLGDVHAANDDARRGAGGLPGGPARGAGAAGGDAGQCGAAARPLRHLRPHRRRAAGQRAISMRRSKAIAAAWRSRRRWPSAIRATSAGSAICPSATIASATCSTGRAIWMARWRASGAAWRSPRTLARRDRRTLAAGSGTCPSATTASATCCWPWAGWTRRWRSYRRGLGNRRGAGGARSRRIPSWQRDLAVSYHKIGSLEIGRGNAERGARAAGARAAPSSRGSTASPRTRRSGAPTFPSSMRRCGDCRTETVGLERAIDRRSSTGPARAASHLCCRRSCRDSRAAPFCSTAPRAACRTGTVAIAARW